MKNGYRKAELVPKELTFYPPCFGKLDRVPQEVENKSKENCFQYFEENENAFSTYERESLKNAFRYISRLIFKEAPLYRKKIIEIAISNGISSYMAHKDKLLNLFDKAEYVSGERYFRKYISNFKEEEQKTICYFMIWFLENKYLRYINYEGKGKRKKMKKYLYIKFKNLVMLPYIESLL